MGRNLNFEFEDYLGKESPEMERLTFHQHMEKRLGMSPRSWLS